MDRQERSRWWRDHLRRADSPTLVVDHAGAVIAWSEAAASLLSRTPLEARLRAGAPWPLGPGEQAVGRVRHLDLPDEHHLVLRLLQPRPEDPSAHVLLLRRERGPGVPEALMLAYERTDERVAVLDRRGRARWVNPAWRQANGDPARTGEGDLAAIWACAGGADREDPGAEAIRALLEEATPHWSDRFEATGSDGVRRVVVRSLDRLFEGGGHFHALRQSILPVEALGSTVETRGETGDHAWFHERYGALPMGVGIAAKDGRVLAANAALLRLMARTEDSLRGMHVLDTIHPDDRDIEHRFEDALSGLDRVMEAEKRLVRGDGSTVWVQLSVSRCEHPVTGEPLALGIFTNIDRRVFALKRLAASEARFRQLYVNSPTGLAVTDETGRFLEANPAFCAILERTEAELHGLCLRELTPPGDPVPPRDAEEQRVARRGSVQRRAQRIERPGGELREVTVQVVALGDGVGEGHGLVVLTDVTAERRAARALIRGEEALERAQALSKTGSWRQSIGADDRSWSRVGLRLVGASAAEAMDPERWIARVHPEDRARTRAAWEGLRDRHETYDLEVRLAGEPEAWIRERAEVERDEDGAPVAYIGTLQDITARQAREAKLVHAQREKEQILNSLGDITVEYISADHRLLWASDNIGLFASDASPHFGQNCHRTLFGREAPCEGCLMPEAMLSGQPREREATTPDGKSWLVRSVPLSDDKGQVTGLVQLGIDITRLRAAEAALEEERERLELVIEGGELGTWDWDIPSGRVTYNERWASMLGYRLEEIPPHVDAWTGLLHPEDAPMCQEALERHFRGETEIYETQHRVRHADGGWVWILDRGRLLERDERGEPRRMCGTHLDITKQVVVLEEERRREEALRQTQKLESLGVLAGGIAHDFNNILMAVVGNLNLAAADLAPTDPVRQLLEEAESASQRAADLTRQLLAYAGRGRARKETMDLSRMVQSMRGLLRSVVPRRIELEFAVDGPAALVSADASQLQQIVMNLVTNGAEAHPDEANGEVRVRCGVREVREGEVDPADALTYTGDDAPLRAGSYASLVVEDRGQGMEAELAGRIFEPFFTTKFAGRGLGLAAVLGIVRGHSGALCLRTAPGQGSRFEVLMPLAETAVATPSGDDSASDGRASRPGRGVLLVVDDEAPVRTLATKMLRRLGFEVVEARDGIEALEALERSAAAIDGVLLDLNMPRLGGEETWRRIGERWPRIEVIVSTGYGDLEIERRLDAEGVRFLQKPYRLGELAKVLNEVFPPAET